MNHYYALYQIAEEHVAKMRCEADRSRKLQTAINSTSDTSRMFPAGMSLIILLISLTWLF